MLLHDLRSPLATVNVYSQLLLQDARTEDCCERIRVIQEAVLRLGALVDQIAGLRERGRALENTLGGDAIDAVELVRGLARAADRVVVTSPEKEIVGYWNAIELQRLVANLIDNALKYSPAPQPVHVTLRSAAGYLVITVVDQGVGIPCAELPWVFQRGYRAFNAKSNFVGDGLGLATVRRIVDAHRGTITVVSNEGVGTSVSVRLPSTRDADNRCHISGSARLAP
jgi:signal transduction histidine kinase